MKAYKQKKAICKILKSVVFSFKIFLFIYHSENNPYVYRNISHLIIKCIKKTARVGYLIAGPWKTSKRTVFLKDSP